VTENKYVFRCSLKVVSDSPVSHRLNGSSFHVCGPAAANERKDYGFSVFFVCVCVFVFIVFFVFIVVYLQCFDTVGWVIRPVTVSTLK